MFELPDGWEMAFELLEKHKFANDGTLRDSLAKAKVFGIDCAIGWDDGAPGVSITVERTVGGKRFRRRHIITPHEKELLPLLRVVMESSVEEMIHLADKMMIESRGYQWPMYLDREKRLLVKLEDAHSYQSRQFPEFTSLFR